MNTLVYKIKSDTGWLASGNELDGSEHRSPIFTNRSNAEKRIRDQVCWTAETIERLKHREEDFKGQKALFNKRLAAWKSARVVAFKLVEIVE